MRSLLYQNGANTIREMAINSEALVEDINLKYIFDVCADGDPFISKTVREVMLCVEPILVSDLFYRHRIMHDIFENKDCFWNLYTVISDYLKKYDDEYKKAIPAFSMTSPPTTKMRNSILLYKTLLQCTRDIHKNAALLKDNCTGMKEYFSEFISFYSYDFIKDALCWLEELLQITETDNITLSASIGYGMKAGDIVIRSAVKQVNRGKKNTMRSQSDHILTGIAIQSQANSIRDGALTKILRIINDLSETTLKHVKSLLFDIAFYLGCANLYQSMQRLSIPVAFPFPRDYDDKELNFTNLVDLSLALQNKVCPIGNSLNCRDGSLIIVTGANQGGKSTFLRSIGIAQLMMQAGMFIAADAFSANCCDGVFTHFCHSDSSKADHGKLDSELTLMKQIISHANNRSMLLMNESFSSTSEKEAVRIGAEIINALYDLRIKTIFVTHFYNISKRIEELGMVNTLFLAATRNEDGTRPYVITKAKPSETSYGLDILYEVFGIGREAIF